MAATAELDPPYGVLSLPALASNAFDLLDRAGGTPLRVASKSVVRCRAVLDAVLALPGYKGVLAYTLPEALWLANTVADVVVGYPTADRAAIHALARDERSASRITLMVDSLDQLDLVDSVLAPSQRQVLRVCIELDVGWRSLLMGYLGVRRSPIHTPAEARALASAIAQRPGFRLVGMMGYEAHIAGVGNKPHGQRFREATVRAIQRASSRELAARRAEAVAAVREIVDLEFVNGGGTGSIESTAADSSVTEVAAGSGLFGPHLFDNYSHFSPAPAAAFALSVVRKPMPGMAVLSGGGWIASGPAGADRAPRLEWPQGLQLVTHEGAGEVQTPVTGAAALAVGDRVWLRHTKAGELSEHLNEFVVVDGERVVDRVATYRGEGKMFL